MTAIRRDIGAFINNGGNTAKKDDGVIFPASVGSATTTGTAIDVSGTESCVLVVKVGLAGAITTVDGKIQESDTAGGSFTDLLDKDGNVVAITTIAAVSTSAEVSARLEGSKSFIRPVVTSVATDVLIDAILVTGGQQVIPA